VTLEATLLDRAEHSQEPFLVLQGGGFVFMPTCANRNTTPFLSGWKRQQGDGDGSLFNRGRGQVALWTGLAGGFVPCFVAFPGGHRCASETALVDAAETFVGGGHSDGGGSGRVWMGRIFAAAGAAANADY